jgi:thiol:disulfide interchange protein DsbD
VPAIYLGALDSLPQPTSGWRKLWKGLGIVMLAYGLLLLVGVAANSTDPLQPLRGLVTASGSGKASNSRSALSFRPVASVADLNKRLQEAAAQGQFVMLDFYADWCVSCKEMERYTFKDEEVIDALRPILLLKADVTDNSEANAELMKHFGLIGPPATLFFNPEGEELKSLRVIGYMEADAFQAHVRKVMPR